MGRDFAIPRIRGDGNSLPENREPTEGVIMEQEKLSQDLIDKAKECTSVEEVTELLQAEGYELPDELVEEISGGLAFGDMLARLESDRLAFARPLYEIGSDKLANGFADNLA